MSAYNLARFNLAQFNVQTSDANWATGAAKTEIGFSFAGTTNYAIGSAAVRILAASLQLDRGRIASGAAAEQFSQEAEINGFFWPIAASCTEIDAELNLSQEIDAAGITLTELEAEINLSQEIDAAGAGMAEFIGSPNMSQIVMVGADGGVIFQATADVISLIAKICEFPGLVLQPGQTLVVDAGSYNVLLDGENAIHLQQGDWLDELNRNTQMITISATGIERVTAEILYTERFL